MGKILFFAAVLLGGWWLLRARPKPTLRLDEAEARAVLGVAADADAAAIRAEHQVGS